MQEEFFQNGYFLIYLLPPVKLQEILDKVQEALQISNPDYDVVIKRLHMYYDMKLVNLALMKKFLYSHTHSNS